MDCRASMFIKSVHALMAQQEMFHQQVMSYLVGGGDHYKSHSFFSVSWEQVHLFVTCLEASPSFDGDSVKNDDPCVSVTVDTDALHIFDIMNDYVYRVSAELFHEMSFWRFCEFTEKLRVSTESSRLQNALSRQEERQQLHPEHERNVGGWKATERGSFLEEHPKSEVYMLHMCSTRCVLVFSSHHLPHDASSTEVHALWCRSMLILFKPWRALVDLKADGESWSTAYKRTTLGAYESKIFRNLEVETECEDVRDKHNVPGVHSILVGTFNDSQQVNDQDSDDIGSLQVSVMNSGLCELDPDAETDLSTSNSHPTNITDILLALERANLFEFEPNHDVKYSDPSRCTILTTEDKETIKLHMKLMQSLKKKPCTDVNTDHEEFTLPTKHRRCVLPSASITDLPDNYRCTHVPSQPMSEEDLALHQIIFQSGIANNKDQLCAFMLVANHSLTHNKSQLRLHIAGIEGSGKSHVINALELFFTRFGAHERLQITAPTGCAAVLIKGHTIHALTLLPKGRHTINQAELENIWKHVDYLIIDDISLVSALLLSDISRHLCMAKSADLIAASKPFGDVNVIFTGDFGQLKLVREHALFSYKLVSKLSPNVCSTEDGQGALYGAYLWRTITDVVELNENWRAKTDPAFVNLLHCMRLGVAWDSLHPPIPVQVGNGMNYEESDYEFLSKHRLQYLSAQEPKACAAFIHAPIIVTKKTVRDAINKRKAKSFCTAVQQDVHYYHSVNTFRQSALPDAVQQGLWNLGSSKTEDAQGLLPLCPGLPVMVTENLALARNIVNGSHGTVEHVKYSLNESGGWVADCVYVRILQLGVGAIADEPDIVPITFVRTSFRFVDEDGCAYNIVLRQVPLLPAFAFTDYKVQGQSMSSVIVDLCSSHTLQSVYVMLSCVKCLTALAVLRWFPSHKIYQQLSQEF